MKFSLEVHRYAPELNRVHFARGGSMLAPGCTTIREARERFFKPVQPGRVARVQVSHTDPEHQRCDRLYQGRIHSFDEFKRTMHQLKLRHNLRDAVFDIRVQTVG